MANLDDELRQAVQACDGVAVTPTTSAGDRALGQTQPQCPSKYEEAQRRGEVMPHASVR